MGLNLSVLPNCVLCLGSADMYVELHEHVVYQLRRRRLLTSLFSRNFDNPFGRERVFYHLNERVVSSRTVIIFSTRSSEQTSRQHVPKHRTFP